MAGEGTQVTPGVGQIIAGDIIDSALHQRVKMTLGVDGTNDGDVSATNPMPVKLTDGTNAPTVVVADGGYGMTVVTPGHVSTGNSTTATLAGGATFTGSWEDTINHGVVQVSVIASHASATNGFVVQYSSDGVNVDNSDSYTIPAATGKLYSFQAGARYFRIVYTNGGTIQTYFRLQTVMKPMYSKPSSHRVGDTLSLEDDAELVKAVIAGESSAGGGSMVNVKVNPSGTLQVETSLGKAEDAAAVSGDVGVPMLAVRTDVPTTATSANGDYAMLTTDKDNHLRVTSPLSGPGTIDTFGALMTAMRNPQINVQFHTSAPSLLTTVTTTGSGSATTSNGGALFATGATSTSSAKSVSLTSTRYTPGGEIYALVTAGFLNGGGATNYQRIGLYDDNNGIFIGYENNSFGVTTRSAGVDTSVAIASWNGDALTGAAGSKFTRNGTPEAINLTFVNVWRFRFGWLGEAPISLEILSPDGQWVTCHTIKQPNTAATPSFRTPVLPITCHVNKTGGATDYQIQTFCWGAGSTMIGMESDDVVMQNAASATGNGTAMSCVGYGTAVMSLTGTFSATVTFEGTTDGTNWSAVSATQIGGSDIATTATTTGLYRIAAAGLDQVRARISAYTSGNVTVIGHATNAMMSSKVVRLASGTNAIGKLAANDGVDIGDVTLNNTTLPVAGIAAHDAAISGNPVRIAGRALTSDFTAVAAGDTTDLACTITGKQVITLNALPGQRWYATGELTSATAVTIKAAAGAGVKNYIDYVKVVNSHQTTGTRVQINDGAAGTAIWKSYCQFAGGGEAGAIDPIGGTANTLLEIKEETATATNGVVYYVSGYTAAE